MKCALPLPLAVGIAFGCGAVCSGEPFATCRQDTIASAVARETMRLAIAPESPPIEQDWSEVRRLSPGTQIEVRLGDASLAPRYFVGADEASLIVSTGPELQAAFRIAKDTIVEIRVRTPYSAKRDALHGLVFGGAGFAAAGVALCRAFGGSGSCAADVARAAATGAGINAALSVTAGAIKHAVKPRTRVIYRAP
jgi:hypothetical protein